MLDKLKKSRNITRIFKEFCDINDLVYFGNVSAEDAEEPITGITFGSSRTDSHFMHGTVNDYDVTILQRESKVNHPSHNTRQYHWTVLKIGLKVKNLPHIFIDAHQYDELLYKDIFTKFSKLRMANNNLDAINESFTNFFHVFATPDMAWKLKYYLPDFVMQKLLTDFQELDVEIHNDSLWVYRNGLPATSKQIQKMLDEGLWFSEHIERVDADKVID